MSSTDDRPESALMRLYRQLQPYEIALVIAAGLVLFLPGIWSYTLIDPWETHYAEVARRMLEDSDWVHLKWQNESFRSKPVLTFWLIATSMKTLGVATLDPGGYSGEMVSSAWVILAVRLPFALFAIMGLAMTWWMLAQLISRRLAWLACAIIATTPFYFMVARQAITDMPMVACVMGALACFAMTLERGDEPVERVWRGYTPVHLFLGFLVLFVGWQALYYFVSFMADPALAPGVRMWQPGIVLPGVILLGLAGLFVWIRFVGGPAPSDRRGRIAWGLLYRPVSTRGQVYMFWFYAFVGVSVLGKGPVGIGLVGAVCFLYLLLTGHWRRMLDIELGRGIAITSLIVVPWHVAMWLKDGRGWVNEYFNHHMLKRVGSGVHGDRGTFEYFASQIGIGMWPWVALLPAALATVLISADRETREGRVKLIVGIWAIAGVALFSLSQTKFHHYILPVIPALAILIAFWLDELIAGRSRRMSLIALMAVALVLLIVRDLIGEPKQLIELFIYRYDRPWPSGDPWNVDLSDSLLVFGLLFAGLMIALSLPRIRRYAALALITAAVVWAFWGMNSYMGAAAPHWGQRELHRTYYKLRQIHGVEIKYYGLRDLADDWAGGDDYLVRSVLPDAFATGAPMKVTIHVPGFGVKSDMLELRGRVSRIGDDRFWIAVPASERAKLAELIERGKAAPATTAPGSRVRNPILRWIAEWVVGRRRRPWVQVDADRLIPWQLNWRGENFWSSGEIYGETPDTQTVYMHTDNKQFLQYVKDPSRVGRRFFVITEAGRASGLKGVLPTQTAKKTVEILDTSCNKFTLLSFTL